MRAAEPTAAVGRLVAAALPTTAIAAAVVIPAAVVWSGVSSGTFAFDFLAYHDAARRVLAGERLYDTSIQVAGGFGLFYYPPPFAVFIAPLGLLPAGLASTVWLILSGAMILAAIAILPVRPSVRWATLLLAGVSWPVVYALKLGQVGPLLLLVFAIGWRWSDNPVRLGLAGAIGAAVKVQPAIILGWALLTRRWAAVAIGVVALLVAAVVATVIAGGPSIWPDYLALLRNVSDPITTPHNFTPGAVAFQMGASTTLAVAIEVASTVLVVAAVLGSALWLRADASFLVAVVASQLLSPVLWDHYAMLLLLPVAWLLDRGHWWAILIVGATSVLTLPIGLPAAVLPASLWAALLGVLVVGWLGRGGEQGRPLLAFSTR